MNETSYRVVTYVDGEAHYLRSHAVEVAGAWTEWTTDSAEAAVYIYRVDAETAAQQAEDISGEAPEVEGF